MTLGKSLPAFLGGFAAVLVVSLTVAPRTPLTAQEPDPKSKPKAAEVPAQRPEVEAAAPEPISEQVRRILPDGESLLPLPEVPFPDDPPPHEGAMIGIPYRVAPPDMISVELLEALPGRPITGQRLVRPDGTISLGFYGDLQVRGLTTVQIKQKIILHMRQYITDEALGLIAHYESADAAEKQPERPKPGAEVPEIPDERSPFNLPAKPVTPPEGPKPKASLESKERRTHLAAMTQQPKPVRQGKAAEKPVVAPGPPAGEPGVAAPPEGIPEQAMPFSGKVVPIPPSDSDRIFVDIASYNSQVYYVQGDVNKPGRIPWTGSETVLDALIFAGDFDPNADPKTLRVVRPARGGKPSKVYPIDIVAIRERGDVRANLQIFPGDRLIVDRSATVQSTINLNRDAAWMNTLMNTTLTYAFVARNLDKIGELLPEKAGETTTTVKVGDQSFKVGIEPPMGKIDPTRRKAALDAWREFLKKSMTSGGPAEQKMIDDVLKALDR